MTREFITECYQHIQNRLELPEYHPLEPSFMQSMANIFDELDKDLEKIRDLAQAELEASRR